MKESELLSIFIPTYNRHVYLKECLDSVLEQVKKYNINIYISNNYPNDTELYKIIENYKKIYSNIFYYENQKNIGIDLNMAKAFEYPKSKYCLMLGDDDFLLENAIDEIINKIKDIDVDFVLLNTNFYSLNNTIKRELLDIKEDEYINNPIDGFKNYGFINHSHGIPYGCLICNLESIKKLNSKDVYRYVETSHLYSGVLWDMLVNKKCFNTALLISKATIGMRQEGEKTWTKDLIDIYFRQVPLWLKKLPSYYKKVSNKFLKSYYKNIFNFRFLVRILSEINFKQRNAVLTYNIPQYIKNRIIFILIFPIGIRNKTYVIYKNIKNIFKYY